MFLNKNYSQQQPIRALPRTPTPPGLKAPPANADLAHQAIDLMAFKRSPTGSGTFAEPNAGAVRPAYRPLPSNFNPTGSGNFSDPNAGAIRPAYKPLPPEYNPTASGMFAEPNAGAVRPDYYTKVPYLQTGGYEVAQGLMQNLKANPQIVQQLKNDYFR